jgi:hypothetical protein
MIRRNMQRFEESQVRSIEKLIELNPEDRSQAIAEMVHASQKDKAGAEYIGHPTRVASIAVRNMNALLGRYSEQEIELVRQACWLHDVLEDSGENGFPTVEPADLESWGISSEVIQLVEIVTKTEVSSKSFQADNYYTAIKANPLARVLKIADITDNHNLYRKEALQELGVPSKNYYYAQALDFLELDSEERLLFEKRINLPTDISDEEWNASLLEKEEVEPSYYTDMSLEDYYYRYRNSGLDENTASARASEQVESDGIFLSYRNEGYSVKRAREKAAQKAEDQK